MDNLDYISIFTESSEDMGILFKSYKGLPIIINKFIKVIESNISKLINNPEKSKINLSNEISKFKSDIDIDFKPCPINMNEISSNKKDIKEFRSQVDDIVDKLANLKKKTSFGGNFVRSIILRPKVYSKDINEESYESINISIRNIDRALDWVEKIIIDLYNMINQDLNILTIVDKVYNKKKIYESYEKDIEDNDEYASRIWNWLESNGPKPLGDVDKDLSDLFKDDGFTVYSRKIAENEVPD